MDCIIKEELTATDIEEIAENEDDFMEITEHSTFKQKVRHTTTNRKRKSEKDKSGVTQLKCKTCGRKYKTKAGLYNHQRWECDSDPKFECTFCPFKTKQKGNLKTHLMSRHNTTLI